jgi:hypothetical protein
MTVLDILEQKCRVCGCTEMRACKGGCHWVTPDLCSACQVDEGDALVFVENNAGAMRIARERLRQLAEENYTVEGDLSYVTGELAAAACCYAMPMYLREMDGLNMWLLWPWGSASWKPAPSPVTTEGRLRELAKAGALIAAEIDRLLAAEPSHDE